MFSHYRNRYIQHCRGKLWTAHRRRAQSRGINRRRFSRGVRDIRWRRSSCGRRCDSHQWGCDRRLRCRCWSLCTLVLPCAQGRQEVRRQALALVAGTRWHARRACFVRAWCSCSCSCWRAGAAVLWLSLIAQGTRVCFLAPLRPRSLLPADEEQNECKEQQKGAEDASEDNAELGSA